MEYRLEAFDRRGFVHVAPSRDRRFLLNPSQPRSGRRIGQFSPAGGTEPGPANVRAGDRALRMSRAGVGVHERRRDEPDGGGTTRPGHPSAASTAMPSTWQVRRRTGPSDTTFLRPPNTSARPNTTRRAKPTTSPAGFGGHAADDPPWTRTRPAAPTADQTLGPPPAGGGGGGQRKSRYPTQWELQAEGAPPRRADAAGFRDARTR